MIDAQGLCFDHPHASCPSLQGITFHVAKGSVVLLCGSNGAGKSTLLRLLAGLLRPSMGSLACAGVRYPGKSSYPPGCALIMQEAEHQILGSTVEEDLLLPWPRPSTAQRARAISLAHAYGLDMKANVSMLSYGQKRRLCIASALMADPVVLLMDEPDTGLDYAGCEQLVADMLCRRKEGMTIVTATHDPSIFMPAMKDEDLMLVLDHGILRAALPLKEAQDTVLLHPEWGIRPWL